MWRKPHSPQNSLELILEENISKSHLVRNTAMRNDSSVLRGDQSVVSTEQWHCGQTALMCSN